MTNDDDQMQKYRSHIVAADQKMQESYDKTIISLSGGALGISIAFIKDIVNIESITNNRLLFCAWICWCISITGGLYSYYFSHLALRKTLRQIDDESIRDKHVGGFFDIVTAVVNAISGLVFIVGVVALIFFINNNF